MQFHLFEELNDNLFIILESFEIKKLKIYIVKKILISTPVTEIIFIIIKF